MKHSLDRPPPFPSPLTLLFCFHLHTTTITQYHSSFTAPRDSTRFIHQNSRAILMTAFMKSDTRFSKQIPRSHPRIARTDTIVVIWQCKSCGYICIDRVARSEVKSAPQPIRECLVDIWTHQDNDSELDCQYSKMCELVRRDRVSQESL